MELKSKGRKGVADKWPRGRAAYLHLLFQLLLLCTPPLLWHAFSSKLDVQEKLHAGVILIPTIESCDPEDLRDVNCNDIQAAGSSFSQETDRSL